MQKKEKKKSLEKRISGKVNFLVVSIYGGIIAAAVIKELVSRRKKAE